MRFYDLKCYPLCFTFLSRKRKLFLSTLANSKVNFLVEERSCLHDMYDKTRLHNSWRFFFCSQVKLGFLIWRKKKKLRRKYMKTLTKLNNCTQFFLQRVCTLLIIKICLFRIQWGGRKAIILKAMRWKEILFEPTNLRARNSPPIIFCRLVPNVSLHGRIPGRAETRGGSGSLGTWAASGSNRSACNQLSDAAPVHRRCGQSHFTCKLLLK